jgi:hypothetical protein
MSGLPATMQTESAAHPDDRRVARWLPTREQLPGSPWATGTKSPPDYPTFSVQNIDFHVRSCIHGDMASHHGITARCVDLRRAASGPAAVGRSQRRPLEPSPCVAHLSVTLADLAVTDVHRPVGYRPGRTPALASPKEWPVVTPSSSGGHSVIFHETLNAS